MAVSRISARAPVNPHPSPPPFWGREQGGALRRKWIRPPPKRGRNEVGVSADLSRKRAHHGRGGALDRLRTLQPFNIPAAGTPHSSARCPPGNPRAMTEKTRPTAISNR